MKNTIKSLSVAAVAALVAFSCNTFPPKGDWGLEAYIDGSQPGDTLAVSYLKKKGDAPFAYDTTIVFTKESQKIQLSAPFIEPSTVVMLYNPQDTLIKPYYVELFVNNAGDFVKVVTKAADFSTSKISGGMYDEPSFDTLRKLTDKFMLLNNQYMQAIEKSDSTSLMDVSVKVGQVQRDYFNSALGYVKSNPAKGYSGYLLMNLMQVIPADSARAIFDKFTDQVKGSSYGKTIDSQLKMFESTSLKEGSVAPNFTVKDMKGKQIKLSDYLGKWVLVDFWGSWCGPCRQSNPGLVKLYAQYKGKGLEIIGLAVNDKPENLAKAIKEDGITWPNADLSQSEQAQNIPMDYSLTSVPTKFLIDPQGKINLIVTGYDEKSDPLAKRLAEVLK